MLRAKTVCSVHQLPWTWTFPRNIKPKPSFPSRNISISSLLPRLWLASLTIALEAPWLPEQHLCWGTLGSASHLHKQCWGCFSKEKKKKKKVGTDGKSFLPLLFLRVVLWSITTTGTENTATALAAISSATERHHEAQLVICAEEIHRGKFKGRNDLQLYFLSQFPLFWIKCLFSFFHYS